MSDVKIKGYRDLSNQEIEAINIVKQMGEQMEQVVLALQAQGPALDQRWVSVGKTHLQQGLMALTRGIAKPTNF
jgi:hypothetical protein